MTVLIDYTYSGNSSMATGWKNIKPHLSLNFPVGTGKIPRPALQDVIPLNLTEKDLRWQMLTMGYGAYADYAIHWILNGIALGASEIADLKRLTAARSALLFRAYELSISAATPLLILPRAIYPLIEASEKTNISYYLGCALASICAPVAIRWRLGASGINYIFHSKLLAASAKAAKTVTINTYTGKEPDFIAFDVHLGIHIIEAKGSAGSFPYSDLADGLKQCADVLDVSVHGMPNIHPVSLNTTVAFLGIDAVDCAGVTIQEGVRCAVVAMATAPATAPKTPPQALKNVVHQLLGTKIFGMYMLLVSAKELAVSAGWQCFQLETEDETHRALRVAVPSQLFNLAQSHFNDAATIVKRGTFAKNLKARLEKTAPAPEPEKGNIDLRNALISLGDNVDYFTDEWRRLPLPVRYFRSESEPWLAFSEDSDSNSAE